MTVFCDYCDRPARLVGGAKVYPHRPDLCHLKFWHCATCDAWVGCHPAARGGRNGVGDGTVPMGRLANATLRRAKQAAHASFDSLWKSRQMTRSQAYAWLAQTLGISPANCHIGMFDEDGCRAVVDAVVARDFT